MSRKTSQPSTSPTLAGGVDFLYRTMIEREGTGKRPVRPKNVDDLLQSTVQDESDDSDFEYHGDDSDSEGIIDSDEEEEDENGSNKSDSGEEGKEKNAEGDDSDESDDEDYDGKEPLDSDNGSGSSGTDSSDDSNDDNESNDSDSDEPGTTKKSALKESLEKFREDTNIFMTKKPARRKKKPAKTGDKVAKQSNTKKTAQNGAKSDAQTSKSSKAKQPKAKKTGKQSKVQKGKKAVIAKKPKTVSKNKSTEKKKRKKPEDKTKPAEPSIMSLVNTSEASLRSNRKEIGSTKPICSACLKDNSDDANEIVECDSCGISVHETCYGLFGDNQSISSGSGSSSRTEPWFCDGCKSGAENISCELCPVEGGLFKETTAHRWVHLVCALYTPGVVYDDTNINLYAIPYSRWGSHNCAACENERLANTGIVISCDAGMCKTYFHATCAQRQGLLSDPVDPNHADYGDADPYFVSCKQHTNREARKRRIKFYNALQEQLRIKKSQKETYGLPSGAAPDFNDHDRILRKLDKVRQKTARKNQKYLEDLEKENGTPGPSHGPVQSTLPESWMNKKQTRMLHTSAKLGRDFMNKLEQLGDDVVAEELEVKHEKIVANIKRKWNVQPAMSVEFAAYYSDRESRIASLLEQHDTSVRENQELMEKEAHLTDVLETQEVNREAMASENESVSNQLISLANILKSFVPEDKQFASKLQTFYKMKDPSSRRKSPSVSRGDRKSVSPRRSSIASGKKSPSRGKSAIIKVCDTCSKSDNQHLITICDKCKKNYHLGCLDPPLDRMPKRTRLCGWICSDCGEAASENESQVDTEAPRTLRGRTKIHKPKKYRGSDDSDIETKTSNDSGSKKSSPKSNVKQANVSEVKMSTSGELLSSPSSSSAIMSPPDIKMEASPNIAAIPAIGPFTFMNGPVSGINHLVPTPSASTSAVPISSEGMDVTDIPSSTTKSSKTKKKPTVPKPPKVPRVKKGANGTPKQPSPVKVKKTKSPSPSKRKSDGPLTNCKVNGINDVTVSPSLEEGATGVIPVVSPKRKQTKKKKNEPAVQINADLSKNGISVGDPSLQDLNVMKVEVVKKPKKSKGKKGDNNAPAAINPAVVSLEAPIPDQVATADGKPVKPVKVKKPRKKKEPVAATEPDPTKPIPEEGGNNPIPGETKKVKKARKARVSSNAANPTAPPSARVEANMVNQGMGKATSQIIESKFKSIQQNGTVKATKKRKSSVGMAQLANNGPAPTPAPDDKEKEKSVPPKKRKRAPSTAQIQQQLLANSNHAGQPLNSVDSIIQAVSCGMSETRENGDHLGSNHVSTIMQGIAPRQLAPEQNLMQGKAMGSAGNSGEMVTVDASFLLDYNPSEAEPKYSATFYSSSSSQENHVGMQRDGPMHGNHVTGNSDQNVIRLQYIEDATPSVSDASAMPPPPPTVHPPRASPDILASSCGVCATCTRTDSKVQLVMCDKCQLEFHFMCLIPPVKFNPRRKGHPWFCKTCDDSEPQENGIARHIQ